MATLFKSYSNDEDRYLLSMMDNFDQKFRLFIESCDHVDILGKWTTSFIFNYSCRKLPKYFIRLPIAQHSRPDSTCNRLYRKIPDRRKNQSFTLEMRNDESQTNHRCKCRNHTICVPKTIDQKDERHSNFVTKRVWQRYDSSEQAVQRRTRRRRPSNGMLQACWVCSRCNFGPLHVAHVCKKLNNIGTVYNSIRIRAICALCWPAISSAEWTKFEERFDETMLKML